MWVKKDENRKRIKSRRRKRKQQVRKGKQENEEGEEGAIDGRTRREEGEGIRKIGREKWSRLPQIPEIWNVNAF